MKFADAISSQFGKLIRARGGLAAVEFAFIAPIMIFLFFAIIEGSSAYSANRKVMQTANMLADLVAQETSVTQSDLDDLFVGMERIIASRGGDVEFAVTSVYLDKATNEVKVHWSRASGGRTSYAANSVFPGGIDTSLLDDTSYLVVAESGYDYASTLSQKIIGAVRMEKLATRWPRLTSKVQFCVSAGNCS
ncbi:MAG: TadE/TadG family type IV pilus assembly protein [Parvularculaceae bacterium]|nr:pilus assembly protein [Parvularculaceae bacterium]